ncbi:Transducin family protein / WD-40 repeat family protein, putative isoform 1 [Hibiscus syriacus]|uniref:Transducin family protein / WD-40 repeat family protein, putative isoform 1 n=1 Tax=Hibiscus syriacus TaxID=106335 RepID=A0A6A2WHU3_HIBSY|nr:Transducin family protein / WD-40 repeat family protein, putative isoform 1 [Hibiscus syriacus]
MEEEAILGVIISWNCNRDPIVSILEFGAVGDGKTLNTVAFQNAIFYLKSFADKGGAQLYVPPGRWLTGSFNLTSHLTLFLEKGAVILGSLDPSRWGIVEPLPSYGRGIELPGGRYRSLVGYMLRDVVITGDNGTIDGQGSVWWEWFTSHSLNYTRPHLVEFVSSKDVHISNITFLNAPAYNIHPVYCSNVHIHNITAYAPPRSPYTVGIVPDSSDSVCIEDCNISTGHDAIALKSGWDEYGIAYGRPTTNVHIRSVYLQSSAGASIAFGSEMSGGIANVQVEHVYLYNSFSGIEFRTTRVEVVTSKIIISDADLLNVNTAFVAIGDYGTHPDEKFDPDAFPYQEDHAAEHHRPKDQFCRKFHGPTSSTPWTCSNVSGYSESVFPEPCDELKNVNTSSSCFSILMNPNGGAATAILR